MSKAHIEAIIKSLTQSKWLINEVDLTNETTDSWKICRPNGDTPLILDFSIFGTGNYGLIMGDETIYNAIGCSIKTYPKVDLYFGKFSGQFQKDLKLFIEKLNQIE